MPPAKKTDKEYVIKFDSLMEDREFFEPGITFEENKNSGKLTRKQVIKPIRMKAGTTKTINQKEYDFLVSKRLLLNAEQRESKEKITKKLANTRSGRAEPKKEMQLISDEDKIKIFVDLPHLVEEE